MFDIGMTELLVIGIVALIVVGPKDLPGMFRTLGRFTAKIKGMAREFQRAMDDAADESGVKDVAKDLRGVTSPKQMGLDKLNEAATKFEKWEPGKSASASASSKGPETTKLSEERAASAAKVREATSKAATERKAAEAAAQSAPAKDTGSAADTPMTAAATTPEPGEKA